MCVQLCVAQGHTQKLTMWTLHVQQVQQCIIKIQKKRKLCDDKIAPEFCAHSETSPPPLPLFLPSCAQAPWAVRNLARKGGGEGGSFRVGTELCWRPFVASPFFFLTCFCAWSYYFSACLIYIVLLHLPSPHSMHLRLWCNTHGFCKFSVEIQSGLEACSLNTMFPCAFCTFVCLLQLQKYM